MTAKSERYDAVVAGGGAVGLGIALGLARRGVKVLLAGAAAQVRDDGRTAALMQPSVAFLEDIGVAQRLTERAYPLAAIRLIDATGGLIQSPTVTFRANELDLDWFALNYSNADLVTAMTAALREEPNATLDTALVQDAIFREDGVTLTLSTGRVVEADVVAAADGQKSPLRQAAGIGTRDWTYDQVALTFHVTHSKDHEDISTEFHTRSGPLTYVPYGHYKSSVVWLVTQAEAEKLKALSPQELVTACQRRSSSLLGDLTIAGPTGAVPMRGLIAKSATAPRLMLAGEALHVFPPVGAQGMNLGFRDGKGVISAIADALGRGQDPGGREALAAYERGRQVDATSRTFGVDLLNRSLISGFLPLDLVRYAGLTAAANIRPLRKFLMRAGMGQSPFAA